MLATGPDSGCAQSTTRTVLSFGHADLTGSVPKASLIFDAAGILYGTTSAGGSNGLGSVFKLNADGSGYSELHDFVGGAGDGAQPGAALLLGADGALYGTTFSGGTSNLGTLFKLQTDGTGYQIVRSFSGSDGANPTAALIQTTNGALYGTTLVGGISNLGTVFSLAPDGNAFQLLRSFSASVGEAFHPRSALLLGADGALYGTTQHGGSTGNGTVFVINPDGSSYSIIHNFGTNLGEGAEPYGGLVQAPNGALFGTTLHGGVVYQAMGTVFTLNTNGNAYAVVKSFAAGTVSNPYGGLVWGTNGMLYGTTCNGGTSNMGAVFSLSTNGSTLTMVKSFTESDGAFPLAALVLGSDGLMYGTTSLGGSGLSGTLFKLKQDGTGYAVLRQLAGGEGDATTPLAAVVQATNGVLYGTASYRDGSNPGAIYRLNPDGSGYAVLKRFTGYLGDGATPYAPLIQANDGRLYGTTLYGGSNNVGTVFRINLDGTGFLVLASFNSSSSGAYPVGGVIQGLDGGLYGTAYSGGGGGYGTVFRMNLNGGGFGVIKNFTMSGGDGGLPYAGLIQGPDGTLYGTTTAGGSNSMGTVFKLSTNGAGYAVIYNFGSVFSDGGDPYSGLLMGADGALYGTTSGGGANASGVAFRLNPDGSGYQILAALPPGLGSGYANCYAPLVQDLSGALYGTTLYGGDSNDGTIFRVTPNGNAFSVLQSFSGVSPDGASPYAGLIRGADGLFYGTTSVGGDRGAGVVFSLVPPAAMLRAILAPPSVQVQFAGVPARSYSVQRAPTPAGPWATLGAAIPDPTGLGQFQDEAPPPGNNFYRTTSP